MVLVLVLVLMGVGFLSFVLRDKPWLVFFSYVLLFSFLLLNKILTHQIWKLVTTRDHCKLINHNRNCTICSIYNLLYVSFRRCILLPSLSILVRVQSDPSRKSQSFPIVCHFIYWGSEANKFALVSCILEKLYIN